jgi:hypothetical protein
LPGLKSGGGRRPRKDYAEEASRPSPAGNHKLIIGHFVGPGKPAFNQGFSQRHPIAPCRGQGAEIPCSEFSRPLRVRQLRNMRVLMYTYQANKATNANGGLKWIQKGGGYWSECNKYLKE